MVIQTLNDIPMFTTIIGMFDRVLHDLTKLKKNLKTLIWMDSDEGMPIILNSKSKDFSVYIWKNGGQFVRVG
jgi:hypothetical protein